MDGERTSREDRTSSGADDPGSALSDTNEDRRIALDSDGAIDVDEVRAMLAEVPASTVITNHAIGLFELGALHLRSSPPRLSEARLAIDALACLVDGLGSRLGEDHDTLVTALANIRGAWVSVSAADTSGGQ